MYLHSLLLESFCLGKQIPSGKNFGPLPSVTAMRLLLLLLLLLLRNMLQSSQGGGKDIMEISDNEIARGNILPFFFF